MSLRLLSLVCLVSLLLCGCETTSVRQPRVLTWNVMIDSTPPGAELSWSIGGEQRRIPLGAAPVQATISIPVRESGFFETVNIFATVGTATSRFSTLELVKDERYNYPFHLSGHAGLLPASLVVDAFRDHQFEVHSLVQHIAEYTKNPDYWSSYLTSFKGRVISVEESRRGSIAQVLVEDETHYKGTQFALPSRLVVVYWPSDTMEHVQEGGFVQFLGRVRGSTTGTNSFGGLTTALTFDACAYAMYVRLPRYHRSNYLKSEKELFEKWAAGTLFVKDAKSE